MRMTKPGHAILGMDCYFFFTFVLVDEREEEELRPVFDGEELRLPRGAEELFEDMELPLEETFPCEEEKLLDEVRLGDADDEREGRATLFEEDEVDRGA